MEARVQLLSRYSRSGCKSKLFGRRAGREFRALSLIVDIDDASLATSTAARNRLSLYRLTRGQALSRDILIGPFDTDQFSIDVSGWRGLHYGSTLTYRQDASLESR